MPMTPKEMARLLKKNGFIEVKCGNGSHRKFQNPHSKKTIVIPFHSKDLGRGLEKAILKEAGLE